MKKNTDGLHEKSLGLYSYINSHSQKLSFLNIISLLQIVHTFEEALCVYTLGSNDTKIIVSITILAQRI